MLVLTFKDEIRKSQVLVEICFIFYKLENYVLGPIKFINGLQNLQSSCNSYIQAVI